MFVCIVYGKVRQFERNEAPGTRITISCKGSVVNKFRATWVLTTTVTITACNTIGKCFPRGAPKAVKHLDCHGNCSQRSFVLDWNHVCKAFQSMEAVWVQLVKIFFFKWMRIRNIYLQSHKFRTVPNGRICPILSIPNHSDGMTTWSKNVIPPRRKEHSGWCHKTTPSSYFTTAHGPSANIAQ